MTLTEFLADRLNETERYLRHVDEDENQRPPFEVDPDWARSMVEAGRKILAAYTIAKAAVPPVDDWYEVADGVKAGLAEGLEIAVRHLAAVHSSHPDYREEWRP